jgi:hypothetical protein
MKSIGIEFKIVAAVAALVASMGMAQAQSSGGGTGAAGSTTSTPAGSNMTQPSTTTSGAMSSGSGMKKKGSSSAQDCRDHANTATGQKRNDTPQNADTDKTCSDMMSKSSMKKSKKSMTGATTGQPAPATSN